MADVEQRSPISEVFSNNTHSSTNCVAIVMHLFSLLLLHNLLHEWVKRRALKTIDTTAKIAGPIKIHGELSNEEQAIQVTFKSRTARPSSNDAELRLSPVSRILLFSPTRIVAWSLLRTADAFAFVLSPFSFIYLIPSIPCQRLSFFCCFLYDSL